MVFKLRLVTAEVAVITSLFAGAGFAQAPAAPTGPVFAASNLSAIGVRAMASTCAACHGTNGLSVGGAVPGLAGINKEYFLNQMQAFREGKRDATIMQQLSKGYSDAEVAALGDYFSAQKR
jgi:cytochrome c553